MPAINVARTDTFEIQRQKINQIGNQIFNISQGGSDLSTGNLKLGDGTQSIPSLGFINQASLGLYRPFADTIRVVTEEKALFDFSLDNMVSYRDFKLNKKSLYTPGLSIVTSGQNYDPGSYTAIPVFGGTGTIGSIDVVVTPFTGQIQNAGSDYIPGDYTDIQLSNGSGSGATASFTVENIDGTITDAGSGYVPGNYTNIPITQGSGSGALADIVVLGDTQLSGTITNPGSGYVNGSYVQVAIYNNPTTIYTVTTTANPGTPPPANVYQINGVTQQTLSLDRGNTYRFDISDASNSGHPLVFQNTDGTPLDSKYYVTQYGGSDFIDFIIKEDAPLGSIKYNCAVHDGMGASITISSGTIGQYGSGLNGIVTISGNQVTNLELAGNPIDYNQGDIITIRSSSVGGSGSGFEFTLNQPVYTGVVDSITFVDIGSGYLVNDTLSFSNTSVGGYGIDFEFTVETNPGSVIDFVFTSKGSNYVVGDLLSLPTADVGTPTNSFVFEVESVGTIETVSVNNPGFGYNVDDVLSVSPSDLIQPIEYNVTTKLTQELTFTSQLLANTFSVGDFIQERYGEILVVSSSSYPTVVPSTVGPLSTTVSTSSSTITVSSTTNIQQGYIVSQPETDTGRITAGTTVQQVVDSTTLILSSVPTASGAANLTFSEDNSGTFIGVSTTTSGLGSGATFDVVREINGSIGQVGVSLNNGGSGYSTNDTVTILGSLIGGTDGVHDIVITVQSASQTSANQIRKVTLDQTQTYVASIVVDGSLLSDGDFIVKQTAPTVEYEINTASDGENYFFIDTGSGETITPNLNLFSGNLYKFNYSDPSNSGQSFALSSFRDGRWSPSLVESVSTTLSQTSKTVIVPDNTGIQVGMSVTVTSGTGSLQQNTIVASVIGSTGVTFDKFPSFSGAAILSFSGVEYTDNVSRESNSLFIKVTDITPTLYYYSTAEQNLGGADGNEAVVSIDQNNPKVFGSGFTLLVADVLSSDIIDFDIVSGGISCQSLTSPIGTFSTINVSSSIQSNSITSSSLTTDQISSPTNLGVSASGSVDFDADININTQITISKTSGSFVSSGNIKTTSSFDSNSKLFISENIISTSATNDLILSPYPGRLTKVTGTTALQIPVGTVLDRPTFTGSNGNGSIRFNTQTNQYEGYNASTTSWASLGGVRDIDGNTYILAELTAGANDNTLWFYNDNNNTLKLTTNFLDFRSVKKISSAKLGLPAFTLWTANTPVSIGQYIKYRNNLYEVTGAGTTATTGSEPVHVSGVQNNGTAQFTWYSLAVGPLEFTEIEELRVAPNKNAPLIINSSLKLGGTTSEQWNTVSTITEDLTLEPADGKKVVIKSNTHLAIPAGNNNQKNTASAVAGSIRFNTEIQQYEGYSGTNWSSLGGVRDVDGNTYIIPETAPAANENILYFFNDNLNTLQLSKTALDFKNIDTITTSGLNNLSIDTPLVTLNLNETTIDNRDVTRTFISSSKQYLDLGLSSGLVVDPILRLDDQGDVYLNTTFGTGTFNGVKVFDGELKEFELADYALRTSSFALGKGAAESSAVDLYSSGTNKGCKVTVVSKSSSGKRSMTEYSVIDNGTDIFFSEYGSLNTSLDQYTAEFDFNATNDVRITLTLSDDHANGDIISFTVLTQVIK